MKKLIPVLCIILILFTAISCNSDNAPSVGGIRISINDGISRGIGPGISLETTGYIVSGYGPKEQEFFTRLTLSETTYSKTDLLPGEWIIKAAAVNEDDTIIGEDTKTITVLPGQTTEVSLTVTENQAEDVINITLTAPLGNNYYAVISKVSDGSLKEYETKQMELLEDGTYSTFFRLMNGYYTLSFTCDSNAVQLPAPEAFRMVYGGTLNATFTAEAKEGGFSVTIDDKIQDTPVLTLTATPTSAAAGENIIITSSADGGSYSYNWYVDSTPRSDSSSDNITVSFTEPGSHEISCIAMDPVTGIIISAKTTVTVTESEGGMTE
ncbi:MAG: PKD domain-containing protein [Bullifex sp.]|nr:PKD domain-containing protein [Bullifex sp.]